MSGGQPTCARSGAGVWGRARGRTTRALAIDGPTREILGWHLPRSGKATTAATAREHARISRLGTLVRCRRSSFWDQPTAFSSHQGVFTSRRHTTLVRSYGLKQEFLTPHCSQHKGMVERVIRTSKEPCIHRPRFDSIRHATRAIGDWIRAHNHRRPHQTLARRKPAEAIRSAP